MKSMNVEEIKKYIPHRYPFLMLDRVIDIQQESLIAIKNISTNEVIFQGHFPQQAIFPGVMMIEAMAQASGLLAYIIAGVTPEQVKDTLYVFAGVDKVRFKKIVTPGDQLKLKIEFVQQKHDFAIFKTKATAIVDDKIVCTAELLVAKKG